MPLARVDEIIEIQSLMHREHSPCILGVAVDLGQQDIAVTCIRLRIPTAGTQADDRTYSCPRRPTTQLRFPYASRTMLL